MITVSESVDPELNAEINKQRKNIQQWNKRRRKNKNQSPNKRPHPKVQNAQWRVLKRENMKPRA